MTHQVQPVPLQLQVRLQCAREVVVRLLVPRAEDNHVRCYGGAVLHHYPASRDTRNLPCGDVCEWKKASLHHRP